MTARAETDAPVCVYAVIPAAARIAARILLGRTVKDVSF